MLEEHVNKEIERHQQLASKIRENIDAWKDQKRNKKLGKILPISNVLNFYLPKLVLESKSVL